MAVTGEIPDVRTVLATQDVVHPTVAQLLIAIAFVKSKENELFTLKMEEIQALVLQGGAV